MTRKPASLGNLAKSLDAKPQSEGDAASPPKEPHAASVPAHRRYVPPARKSDQLNIRVTPENRARFQAIADKTGAPLTVVFEWAIDALERELDR